MRSAVATADESAAWFVSCVCDVLMICSSECAACGCVPLAGNGQVADRTNNARRSADLCCYSATNYLLTFSAKLLSTTLMEVTSAGLMLPMEICRSRPAWNACLEIDGVAG